MPKPCNANQVVNPKTGRCVKKDGAIGKKLLGQQKPDAMKKAQCKDGKVRNPKTGRCVKKDGAIGRKLVTAPPSQAKKKSVMFKVNPLYDATPNVSKSHKDDSKWRVNKAAQGPQTSSSSELVVPMKKVQVHYEVNRKVGARRRKRPLNDSAHKGKG